MAEKKKFVPEIRIEGARILWRNFAGKEGQYNAKGNRNFNVILPPEIVDAVVADGWNVKWLEPREEGDERQARLEVVVRWNPETGRGPKVMMITSGGQTQLGPDLVGNLDFAEIQNVDVVIRPNVWDFNGKSGVKAYLKAIYVTIVEDEFEKKYADIPIDSAQHSIEEFGDPDADNWDE